MLILRGNATTKDQANDFPDEQGKPHVWPEGALHERAARAYAKQLGYDDVMVEGSGSRPRGQGTKQTDDALKKFHEDEEADIGFYGFSGGGYTLWEVLKLLTTTEPKSLHRIKDVVVVGAPNSKGGDVIYKPAYYIALVLKDNPKITWEAPGWKLKYKEDPKLTQMPKGVTLPEGADAHMFGPDILLSGWPDDPKPEPKPKPAPKPAPTLPADLTSDSNRSQTNLPKRMTEPTGADPTSQVTIGAPTERPVTSSTLTAPPLSALDQARPQVS